MRSTMTAAGGAALALSLVASVAPTAAAEDGPDSSGDQLEELTASELVDLLGPAVHPVDSGGLVSVGDAGVPSVGVRSATGLDFSFGLPTSLAPKPLIVDSATTTFSSADGSHELVVEELGLNSFRAVIVMNDASAPSEYRFDLNLPPGWTVVASDDGEVIVSNVAGAEVGRVALPWAYDATGAPVGTHFEVVGSSIVQTVRAEGATFPVVADPAFQGDCGDVTCTARLDRAQTKNARDAGGLIAIAGALCASFSSGTLAPVCGLAVAPVAGVLAIAANRYYDNGNCLGVRFSKYPLPWPFPVAVAWPTEVKFGAYNCK